MNQVIEMPKAALVQQAGRMSAAEVTQHAIAVQEVMQAVMKEGEHYGTIPGTDKPTLYKAGAEKLCMTFRIADEYRIEDLSTGDLIRYRVTCIGRHQLTGVELGSGMGEGSTGEEKYRWRKAVCQEEFDATPANLRRVKYARGKGGSFHTINQIRTEPADLANTVLKMACKRAKMAMVLNVTAASDCFTQDLEDLTEELREHLTQEEEQNDRDARRQKWISDQLENIASARTGKELKGILAYALEETRIRNDQEAAALIREAANKKVATAKPKTTEGAPE